MSAPIADLVAGEAFVQTMVSRADSWSGQYPLWHGWVIMDAFLAGIKYAERDALTAERDALRATLEKAREDGLSEALEVVNKYNDCGADFIAGKIIDRLATIRGETT